MDTPVIHLFVYGSLRRGFQHPVFDYIKNHFSFVADAKVKGRLFDLGVYPAAVPWEDGNGLTGELFVANSEEDFDWAIAQLDDYEGLNPEADEAPLYRREQVTVNYNGSETKAWIYWYNKSVEGNPVIESGDVMEYFKNKQA
jgi:gamma-glutamylcyclotransferase (GGCT)/AIG2-like uncharacterized protein YtfP